VTVRAVRRGYDVFCRLHRLLLVIVGGQVEPGDLIVGWVEYQRPVTEAPGLGRDVRGDGREVAAADRVPVVEEVG
jgi:hypothetical protein